MQYFTLGSQPFIHGGIIKYLIQKLYNLNFFLLFLKKFIRVPNTVHQKQVLLLAQYTSNVNWVSVNLSKPKTLTTENLHTNTTRGHRACAFLRQLISLLLFHLAVVLFNSLMTHQRTGQHLRGRTVKVRCKETNIFLSVQVSSSERSSGDSH